MILMAPPILRKIIGQRGVRGFDPALPLFVRRRISLGVGEDGAPKWLEPGARFPLEGVKRSRIAGLFASRHIAHERPGDPIDMRGRTAQVPDLVAPQPVSSSPVAAEPPDHRPPPKRHRSGA